MKQSIIAILISLSLYAAAKDNKVHSNCVSIPMKSGTISFDLPDPGHTPSGTLLVTSDNDQVYSISTGEVTSIFNTTDASNNKKTVVIVKYASDSFITYSNLKNIMIKKGDKIVKSQLFARATINPQSGKNELGIAIWTSKTGDQPAKSLGDPYVASFIHRADKN